MIERADVEAARRRVGDRLRRTPVFDATVPGPDGPLPVTFKLEYLQLGGSFKARGSLNALLDEPVPPDRVVIASGGNAAIAAAHAARLLGVACDVVVPESAPAAKIAIIRGLGAGVVRHGATYAAAFERATRLAAESGALQLHAYDLPAVVAGAGTVGLELAEQAPGPGPVLIAVGGGGLVAGVATALGRDRRVVGVEPVGIPTLRRALENGAPVDVPVESIATDALGATRLGTLAMAAAERFGIESVLVEDAAIVAARGLLWREFRIAVEWAGATALAALVSGAYRPAPGERPVVVLCGANTDPATLSGSAGPEFSR